MGTLQNSLTMEDILYYNFLHDPSIYNLAQGAWSRVVQKIAKEGELSLEPYINTSNNGQKEYDGNPIFNAFIPELKKAVRIIQVDPNEEGDEITAWVDTIELPTAQQPVAELVIDLKLTRSSKEIARYFIEMWLLHNLDQQQIDEVLAKRAVV